MPDTWTAEQSMLVSKYATEAGRWRGLADGLARLLRLGQVSGAEVAHVLAAYDELTALCDGDELRRIGAPTL